MASIKTITKQDGTHSEVGESLDFKVIEFAKDDRKIVVSHSATYQTEETVEKKAKTGGKKKKDGDNAETPSASSQSNSPATSTLGDLTALSALKEQMDAAKDS
jgi:small subunit ribosomal protein S1